MRSEAVRLNLLAQHYHNVYEDIWEGAIATEREAGSEEDFDKAQAQLEFAEGPRKLAKDLMRRAWVAIDAERDEMKTKAEEVGELRRATSEADQHDRWQNGDR